MHIKRICKYEKGVMLIYGDHKIMYERYILYYYISYDKIMK